MQQQQQHVRLRTSDGTGKEVVVEDVAVLAMSGTIHSMLEDRDVTLGEDATIPVPNVSSASLLLVLEWCRRNGDTPRTKGPQAAAAAAAAAAWNDAFFSRLGDAQLVEVMSAASYLDVQKLFGLLCKRTAKRTRGKSSDEIRGMLGIVNDLSPEQEAQLARVNCWLFGL